MRLNAQRISTFHPTPAAVNEASQPAPSKLLVSDGKIFRVAHYEDIVCIQADHHYANVSFTQGKDILSSDTLTQFEKNLPPYFFRIHKSTIINLHHLHYFDRKSVDAIELSNGMTVQLAHRRVASFLKRLRDVM